MNQSQDAEGDGNTELHPLACQDVITAESASMFADDTESSGCVSYDTVVDTEESPELNITSEKEQGDWSTHTKTSKNQSNEKTSTIEKKATAWKSLKKTTSALSSKAVGVRKKNDPLMTKFKFSLRKYNKSLKITTDGQVSLKYMYDKLVKLKQELLQSGNYQEEELLFDSPNFTAGSQPCDVGNVVVAPDYQQKQNEWKKMKDEKEMLAVKLSELEHRNHELEEMLKINVKALPISAPSDNILTKTLRAKIKSSSAKIVECEKKIEELKNENSDFKKQLFESKTTIDELKVLHMQAVAKHREALEEIEVMNKEVEIRNEETKNINEKMNKKLSLLKSEYETFQMENEIFRKMIAEIKLDYNETLGKCKEASKTWEAINDKYVSQKQMKDAIVTDFVKLGVNYKKLQLEFEELVAANAKLKKQAVGKQCRRNTSYRCLHRKDHHNQPGKQVRQQRRIAVQTSNPVINLATISRKGSPSYCGDGQCLKYSYDEQSTKLEKEIDTLKEENANLLEKHKLLIRQVFRLDKQCHLMHAENRKNLKLVGDLKNNSKLLEEEVAVLRNKLPRTEAKTCCASKKKLPSESSSLKTKKSKLSYVVVKNTSNKNVAPPIHKKTWLKSFWSKENKFE